MMTHKKNAIYLSTGAFIGRRNGRNHQLATQYADMLDCDGFEVLIFDDWYNRLDTIVKEYQAHNLNIPVVHADKTIGDLLGDTEDTKLDTCYDLMRVNCNAAKEMGASKLVIHI